MDEVSTSAYIYIAERYKRRRHLFRYKATNRIIFNFAVINRARARRAYVPIRARKDNNQEKRESIKNEQKIPFTTVAAESLLYEPVHTIARAAHFALRPGNTSGSQRS